MTVAFLVLLLATLVFYYQPLLFKIHTLEASDDSWCGALVVAHYLI